MMHEVRAMAVAVHALPLQHMGAAAVNIHYMAMSSGMEGAGHTLCTYWPGTQYREISH